jgi:hypothetical protein
MEKSSESTSPKASSRISGVDITNLGNAVNYAGGEIRQLGFGYDYSSAIELKGEQRKIEAFIRQIVKTWESMNYCISLRITALEAEEDENSV